MGHSLAEYTARNSSDIVVAYRHADSCEQRYTERPTYYRFDLGQSDRVQYRPENSRRWRDCE